MDPDSAEKIEAFIQTLHDIKSLKSPFTLVTHYKLYFQTVHANKSHFKILDDPSGNSFVENPKAPLVDPALTITHYSRNKEQDHLVGIYEEELKEIVEEDETQGKSVSSFLFVVLAQFSSICLFGFRRW